MAGMASRLSFLVRRAIEQPDQIPTYFGRRLLAWPSLSERESLYRLSLRLRGASLSPDRPDVDALAPNTALATAEEAATARSAVQSTGLHPHPYDAKNWDALLALDSILEFTTPDAAILDAGGATYSPLVEWLYLYGYRNLYANNINFEGDFRRGPIEYVDEDFTESQFEDNTFDVITSLSVVEHDVDARAMFEEFDRILKPESRLILSTDYYPMKIETSDLTTSYGDDTQRWTIFDEEEIRDLIETAGDVGFVCSSEPDLTADERVVSWRGCDYTFLTLEFERRG